MNKTVKINFKVKRCKLDFFLSFFPHFDASY